MSHRKLPRTAVSPSVLRLRLCRDPSRGARDVEQFGAFIEVHVATSIEECERRDRKGLYKLAREGKIKEFTGIQTL